MHGEGYDGKDGHRLHRSFRESNHQADACEERTSHAHSHGDVQQARIRSGFYCFAVRTSSNVPVTTKTWNIKEN